MSLVGVTPWYKNGVKRHVKLALGWLLPGVVVATAGACRANSGALPAAALRGLLDRDE